MTCYNLQPMPAQSLPLVTTFKERCRVCYTCVRECPAKAIRITASQAEVIPERCIGCGNCVRVCSQHAKQVVSSKAEVWELLSSGQRVAALLAPSFPASFAEVDHRTLVGMLRELGFAIVNEVAFGADLVALEYRKLVGDHKDSCYISTACPAIVGFVERYHPALVEFLAPIASPMIVAARVLRKRYGDDLKVVFIGPCIAKKGEAWRAVERPDVDEVLTFVELNEMLQERAIDAARVTPSEFDLPHPGLGALFPVSRGMLQSAGIQENLLLGQVVTADGRADFQEVIREFESGDLDVNARLLELLCCNGCIMGSGMTSHAPLFRRQAIISKYVRKRMATFDEEEWQEEIEALAGLDMSPTFFANDQRIPAPSDEELAAILARMGKQDPSDELNCGACGYDTCRQHAIAIYTGLAESEMCLPYAIDRLGETVKELHVSHEQLASTQQALMHSERLASMGQLAAGIAHEVNNPLGVVLLFAHVLLEDSQEDSPLRGDLEMIVSQADRCKKIVAGLLDFARQNKVFLQEVSVRELIEQGLRTVQVPDSVKVEVRVDSDDVTAELDRDQIIQVLTNLVGNAVEAMPDGGVLTISAEIVGSQLVLSVADTGTGISKENMNKIFEPFFTTKPMGKGTGLGLPVSYGIVKMHRGEIRATSNVDPALGPTGTTFTVTLPRQGAGE
jgi:signal transduction histidine kinase/ferredoxin